MAAVGHLKNSVHTHLWCLIIAIATFWSRCESQHVSLIAASTGQSTPYSAYFADGQRTGAIGSGYLPTCVVISGSGPYVRMEKLDGSLRISEQSPLVVATILMNWNTTAHPTLDTSYSGTYVCRTSTTTSVAVYRINVVQRIVATQRPSVLLVNATGAQYSIMSNVSPAPGGNLSVSWTPSIKLSTLEQSPSRFSFLTNDSGIQVGVSFTVNLTAQYLPAVPCAGNTGGAGYMLPLSVVDNCNAAAMPRQATTKITVRPTCPSLTISSIKRVERHPIESTVMISCIEGYGNPMPQNILCLAGGVWSAQPDCSPVDECTSGMHNCSDVCIDATPGFACNCFSGVQGCLAAPQSTSPAPAATAAANPGVPTARSSTINTVIMRTLPAGDAYNLGSVIGAAAGGTVFGMLLILGIVVLTLKHRKTRQTEGNPAPADAPMPTTQNDAYEVADAEMMQTPMTGSAAYGVIEVPRQPTYEHVLP